MTPLRAVESCGHHLDPTRHHCPNVECFQFHGYTGMRQATGTSVISFWNYLGQLKM